MNNAQIESLINGLQFSDPRTAEVLRLLNKESQRATAEMDSRLKKLEGPFVDLSKSIIPQDVLNFQAVARAFSVHFTFDRTNIAQRAFEIRVGTSWDNSQRVLTTASLQFDIDPILKGNYIYFIKAISVTGNYSQNAAFTFLSILGPSSVTISSSVIDNNVLLSWTLPTSEFQIDYYKVLRNGVEIGHQGSSFFAIFEPQAGIYTYSIVAYDIAGNTSPMASQTISVSTPTDYEIEDVRTSDLNGTRVNAIRNPSPVKIIATANITESWQDHFVNNGFATPQDQINAGYPIYIQPTPATGSYEEVHDYGVTFTNVLITVTWNKFTVVPDVNFAFSISYSTNGISYSTPVPDTHIYAVNLRYLKIRFDFTAT